MPVRAFPISHGRLTTIVPISWRPTVLRANRLCRWEGNSLPPGQLTGPSTATSVSNVQTISQLATRGVVSPTRGPPVFWLYKAKNDTLKKFFKLAPKPSSRGGVFWSKPILRSLWSGLVIRGVGNKGDRFGLDWSPRGAALGRKPNGSVWSGFPTRGLTPTPATPRGYAAPAGARM